MLINKTDKGINVFLERAELEPLGAALKEGSGEKLTAVLHSTFDAIAVELVTAAYQQLTDNMFNENYLRSMIRQAIDHGRNQ